MKGKEGRTEGRRDGEIKGWRNGRMEGGGGGNGSREGKTSKEYGCGEMESRKISRKKGDREIDRIGVCTLYTGTQVGRLKT